MNNKKPIMIGSAKDNRGFTLIEVLIAIGIFAIGFLAVGTMQINALTKTNSARRTTEALTLAEDKSEELMIQPLAAVVSGTEAAPPFTVRWTVLPDVPIPAYDSGVFEFGTTTTRSKTVRVSVTPTSNPNDIQAEIWFAKFRRMDPN